MKKLPVLLFLSVLAFTTFSVNAISSKKGRTKKNPIHKQQTVVQNEKLTASLQRLTSGNKQLLKTVQQLTSGNKQLLKTVQQLTSGNKQLLETVQQLTSGNKQLLETVQQLTKDKKVDFPEQAQTTETVKYSDGGNDGMYQHKWSYGPNQPMDEILINVPEGNYAQHVLLDKSDQKDIDHSGMVNVKLWIDDFQLNCWVEQDLYDKGYYDYLKLKDGELFCTRTNNESSSNIISKLKEEVNEVNKSNNDLPEEKQEVKVDETSSKIDNVEIESQDNNETFEEVENGLNNDLPEEKQEVKVDETSSKIDNVEIESQDNNETFEEVENGLNNEGD